MSSQKTTDSYNSSTAKIHSQAGDVCANEASSLGANSDPDMFDGVHLSILEVFANNLNWGNKLTPQQHESIADQWIPPEEKSVSHAMRLLNNDLAIFRSNTMQLRPLAKDDKLILYIPGLPPNYQMPSPHPSVLEYREQKQLYQLYQRMFYRNRNPLSERELTTLTELRSKVFKEYAEFQEYAKSDWCNGQWKRVMNIPPEVDKYISDLWKMQANQCLDNYPSQYKYFHQIPLALNDPHMDFSVFDFVKGVYTKGTPSKMCLRSIKEPVLLISNFMHLSRIKPVDPDHRNRPKPVMQAIPPVSLDNHVNNLLKEDNLNIDVVISMSGIKTIIDNFKLQKEWILPITVKDVPKNNGEAVKRVVIIDKKLPPNSMSVHEKNLWHAKIVSKWMLALNKNPDIFEVQERVPITTGGGRESISHDMPDVGKLDLDGFKSPESLNATKLKINNKPPPASKIKASLTKPNTSYYRGSSKDAGKQGRESLISYDDPFIDTVTDEVQEFGVITWDMQSQHKPKKPQETGFSSTSVKGNSMKRKIDLVFDSGNSSTRNDLEDGEIPSTLDELNIPRIIPQVAEGVHLTARTKRLLAPCLHYHLWRLQKSNYVQFLKLEQRSLNVLVRTRLDGDLLCFENNCRKWENVCVSSKVEFQPEFGASKMTTSELIREYLDLYFRPDTKLVRVRSIGHTKELMLYEQKKPGEVKQALLNEVPQVNKLFDPLYAVLTKLIDLPPGRYLLRHKPKMGPFATVVAEKPGCTDFNLRNYYEDLTTAEVNVPPTPIDPLVLTALQHRDFVAPALFAPKRSEATRNPSSSYFCKPKSTFSAKRARKGRNKKRRAEDKRKALAEKKDKQGVSSEYDD